MLRRHRSPSQHPQHLTSIFYVRLSVGLNFVLKIMQNRRYSEISESEKSEIESEPSIPSTSKNKVKQHISSNDSSSDISQHEQIKKRNSVSFNNTKSFSSPKSPVVHSLLEKFTAHNPELVTVKMNKIISKHDEVCILQCPKTIAPHQLIGKTINFDSKTKVKLEHIKYVIQPSEKQNEALALLAKKLQIIHPIANLKLQHYTKQKDSKDFIANTDDTKILLPDNLKVRHPLFGPEYKNKIELSEDIEKKLNNAIDNFVTKTKKKKKHKDKVKEEPPIFTFLEEHNNHKELKDESIFSFQEENSFEKKKNKKSKNRNNNLNTEEKKFNSTAIHEFQLPNFDLDFSSITDTEENVPKKKKKKDKSLNSVLKFDIKHESDDSHEVVKVKKEKSFDEVDDVKKEKKKKRQKSESESSEVTPKKKHKKNETDSLITDILNSVKNELNNSVKHKKK